MSFLKKLFGSSNADKEKEDEKLNEPIKTENTYQQYEEIEDEVEKYEYAELDDNSDDHKSGLFDNLEPVNPVCSGKAAGIGAPGQVPSNYNPNKDNPISVYRNVAGCTRDDIWDYMMTIDTWNWQKYDYKSWPCADETFPDLEEDKKYDLWPYKKDLTKAHWVDLNNQFKSGVERKGFLLGFETPEQYVGLDAQKCVIEFEALAKETDESKLQAAGFTSRDHLKYIIESTKKRIKKAYAEAQAVIDESTEKLNQQMNANIDAAKSNGLLDPIKGITLEDWAAANAKIASGMPLNDVLKVLVTEKPIWDEASTEWMARMTRDSTFAISKVYGDAFTNSNIGKFAGASAATDSSNNPIVEQIKNDLDLYVKIMCHQNIGSTQGIDSTTILKQYGLSVGDWGIINGHWSPQLGSNLEKAMKMSALMDKYNAAFSASAPPKAGSDIDF